jgi:hypothetical protein
MRIIYILDNSTQTATVREMRFCEKCNIWHTPGQHPDSKEKIL